MKRFLIIAIPVFVLGFLAGNAFWYLASPLWIDQVVSEELPAELQLTTLAEGTFEGTDNLHQGSGTVKLLETGAGSRLLRFTDFMVTNGPALKVYLSAHEFPTKASDVLDNDWVSLSQLKGNIGDQTYSIAADVDLSKYKSVVIWCEPFRVVFSRASLNGS